jgi:hypothetical protein
VSARGIPDGCSRCPYCTAIRTDADLRGHITHHCLDNPLRLEVNRLRALINTPHVDDFLEAVRIEAAHQCERWGTANDEGKSPNDWFWLLGYLAGKAVWSAMHGDREKALHHTISSAAVLLNWHAHLSGERTRMRPGIEPPTEVRT